MTSQLRNYQALTTGLTQQDIEFRNALEELSGQPTDFYDYQTSAYNRLNHALVGSDIDLQHPVKIAGLIDYDAKQLMMSVHGNETTYNLDDLDPRYLSIINQANPNKKLRKLPLTDIATEMLDDLTPDVKPSDKPVVEPHSLSNSREILRRSFANEMVLQSELQEFVDDHGLEGAFNKNKDHLLHLVDNKSFEASFNDGLKDLDSCVAKHDKLKL